LQAAAVGAAGVGLTVIAVDVFVQPPEPTALLYQVLAAKTPAVYPAPLQCLKAIIKPEVALVKPFSINNIITIPPVGEVPVKAEGTDVQIVRFESYRRIISTD
jgi:hypothetical protein